MTKETQKLLPLAAYGLTRGVFNVYIRPELTAERAWLSMGLGILAYELAAPDGQLLSEGVDRALIKHPTATKIAIGVTALHLANSFEAVKLEKFDPFCLTLNALRRCHGSRA